MLRWWNGGGARPDVAAALDESDALEVDAAQRGRRGWFPGCGPRLT